MATLVTKSLVMLDALPLESPLLDNYSVPLIRVAQVAEHPSPKHNTSTVAYHAIGVPSVEAVWYTQLSIECGVGKQPKRQLSQCQIVARG